VKRNGSERRKNEGGEKKRNGNERKKNDGGKRSRGSEKRRNEGGKRKLNVELKRSDGGKRKKSRSGKLKPMRDNKQNRNGRGNKKSRRVNGQRQKMRGGCLRPQALRPMPLRLLLVLPTPPALPFNDLLLLTQGEDCLRLLHLPQEKHQLAIRLHLTPQASVLALLPGLT